MFSPRVCVQPPPESSTDGVSRVTEYNTKWEGAKRRRGGGGACNGQSGAGTDHEDKRKKFQRIKGFFPPLSKQKKTFEHGSMFD
jgi:hypothetical protein